MNNWWRYELFPVKLNVQNAMFHSTNFINTNNKRGVTMKRELQLEIKQDVISKEYEVKIVKQTHREQKFGKNNANFNHNGFIMHSCERPQIRQNYPSINFNVRGYNRTKDDTVCRTKDSDYIEKLIMAVEAYNAQEENTHLDGVKEKLKEKLETKIKDLKEFIPLLDGISTDKSILEWKKDLMLSLIDYSLGYDDCPYCAKNGVEGWRGAEKCNNCEYGKAKGICRKDGSVVKRMALAEDSLTSIIREYTL